MCLPGINYRSMFHHNSHTPPGHTPPRHTPQNTSPRTHTHTHQWRIYIVKFWTRAPPRGSKFFQFHAVFGKIWRNRMLAPPPLESWRPLLGEILDPPLHTDNKQVVRILLECFLPSHYVLLFREMTIVGLGNLAGKVSCFTSTKHEKFIDCSQVSQSEG